MCLDKLRNVFIRCDGVNKVITSLARHVKCGGAARLAEVFCERESGVALSKMLQQVAQVSVCARGWIQRTASGTGACRGTPTR